jgi:hypothetical protein
MLLTRNDEPLGRMVCQLIHPAQGRNSARLNNFVIFSTIIVKNESNQLLQKGEKELVLDHFTTFDVSSAV